MTRQRIREELFKLLFRIEFNDSDEMPEQLKLFFLDSEGEIEEEDETYITQKYENIVDKLETLDKIIGESAKGWTPERMGKVDLTILRLAVYEIKFDDDIPTGVAIDQAVEIAKKYGQDGSSAFVNGVLAGVAK